MYLQTLDIAGFKSFANKTALQFDQGITCIVGPNGSGKSNVADAIRWVQGEQSLKLLRGKKSEDVIFAGSKKKSRLGFAEVTLHLNNEDQAAPIDYTEVAITRRVYRSGESEYYINKNKVRLTDVQLLLAKSNIGQRTYNVIGQGMVDAVLSATPTERKGFFDEAAGIKQFQIKKEHALHKLELTKENLRQVEALLQEIEPRLRSLTRQVKRLERRAVVEQDLAVLLRSHYTTIWKDLSGERDTKRGDLATREKELAAATKEVEQHEQELDRMAREDSRAAAFKKLQSDHSTVINEKNSYLRERAVLQGKADLEWEKQGDANLVWYEKRKEELDHSHAKLSAELTTIRERLERLRRDRTEKEQRQQSVRADFSAVEEKLKNAEAQLVNFGGIDPTELRTQLRLFQEHHEQFFRKLSRAQSEDDIAKLKEGTTDLTDELTSLVERVDQYAAGATADTVQRLRQELMHFVETRDTLVNELTTLQAEVQVQESRATQIQEQRSHVEEERTRVRKDLDFARLATKDKTAALKQVEEQRADLDAKIADAEKREQEIAKTIDTFNASEESKRQNVFALQKKTKESRATLSRHTSVVNELRVELARIETHAEDVAREMRQELSAENVQRVQKRETPDELPEQYRSGNVQTAIEKLRHQLELIGGIDPEVHDEHTETEQRYSHLRTESNDLAEAIVKTEKVIEDLDKTIKQQFTTSFKTISEKFTEYFRILFNGGTAKLSLVQEAVAQPEADDGTEENEDEPIPTDAEKVVTGVEISATPPGKRLKGIAMLSGGERALTSIALICAILANNPSPFVVLDEVDAALDEANSERFAAILARLAKQTQFVTITHNRATMHEAQILYGVTMGEDGISKLLSMKLEDAEAQAFANR